MKNIYQVTVLLLILAIALASCADKTIEDTNPERPKYDPSPTVVAERYLNAQKDEDFKKAYKYEYSPSSDEAGYVIEMKRIYQDNQLKINNFQILGTEIFELSATVVVELDISRKSKQTGQMINVTQRSKYGLGLFDKKWKITGSSCIENCRVEEVPEIEITE